MDIVKEGTNELEYRSNIVNRKQRGDMVTNNNMKVYEQNRREDIFTEIIVFLMSMKTNT